MGLYPRQKSVHLDQVVNRFFRVFARQMQFTVGYRPESPDECSERRQNLRLNYVRVQISL